MRGRGEVITVLLGRGADVNTQDNGGVSPLLHAVGAQNVGMVKVLTANGADLEAESRLNKMTPLLLAIEHHDIEAIRVLLDAGAKVNGTNRDGLTPLMAASEKGQADVVQILLSRGAEVKDRDVKGRTALMLAKKSGHGKVVKLLKK